MEEGDLIPVSKIDASLIGKVVSIQMFTKNLHEKGMLMPNSMVKFIGVLQAHIIKPDVEIFYIEGIPGQISADLTKYVEVSVFVPNR